MFGVGQVCGGHFGDRHLSPPVRRALLAVGRPAGIVTGPILPAGIVTGPILFEPSSFFNTARY
jgi:hypothetical protein